jgi:hypothetical protein
MGVSAISDAAPAFPAATITGEAQSAATAAPIKVLLHEIGKRMGPSSKFKFRNFIEHLKTARSRDYWR